MPVTADIQLTVSGRHVGAADLGTPTFPFAFSAPLSLTNGTGASQVDRVWSDERTLAASGTEDIDLAGVLSDIYGAALSFAKIKAVFVKAAAGNTNDVVVSRPASNGVPLFAAAGDAVAVKPGGAFALFWPGAGVSVAAGTADLLTFTNSAAGSGVTFQVVILGTSA